MALGPGDAAALRDLARNNGVSAATVLCSAWAVVLGRHSGQDDVVFGTAFSGRGDGLDGALDMVGLLMATLPVRLRLDGDRPFADLLQHARRTLAALHEHQHTPLTRVRESAGLSGGAELFDTLLVVESYPVSAPGDWNGITASGAEVIERPHYALTLAVVPGRDEIVVKACFDGRRLDRPAAERILTHFCTLLHNVAGDAAATIGGVPMLDEGELRRVAIGPGAAMPDHVPVHELIAAQCARRPGAVALVCGDQQVTYAELDAWADQVAASLLRLGVGADTVVGVCAPRSPGLVAGLLGVLKAGAAYLPLDPELPPGRLAFMLDDSGARVVVTDSVAVERLPRSDLELVLLDQRNEGGPAPAALPPCSPDQLAYLMYTSGSTGVPKGVMIDHRALASYVGWASAAYDAPAPRGSVLHGSVGFDLIVTALYVPLVTGRCITVLEPGTALAELPWPVLREHAVVKLTPSHVGQLVEAWESGPHAETAVRTTFVIGGESLRSEHARALLERDAGVVVVNEYGPTEATVGCVVYETSDPGDPQLQDGAVPIGRPIPGAWIRLVAADGSLAPPGAPGEVWIGGPGLARGYWRRGEETSLRFRPDPCGHGRMYRTGDMARLLPDGALDYLGRGDRQVKVRGHRVELDEVEEAVRRCGSVAEAVVRLHGSEDAARLTAYVVWREGQGDHASLLAALRHDLPSYMLPSTVVELTQLPLTPNGKLDATALPEPVIASSHRYIAPRNELERLVASTWSQVLGCDAVGGLDDFFELGGDSLQATKIVARLRTVLGRRIPLRSVFEQRTVQRLARSLASSTAVADEPVEPRPADAVAPLSYGQQQLWLVEQMAPGRAVYNVPGALRLTGQLDEQALAAAVGTVVERHQVLRSRFDVGRETIRQALVDQPIRMEISDLRDLGRDAAEHRVRQLMAYDAVTPFDLGRGPLLRVRLVRLARDVHILLVVCHHVITDAWSTRLLWDELLSCYEQIRTGEDVGAPRSALHYADYAWWQREGMSDEHVEPQLAYWREHLAGLRRTELCTDLPRPTVRSGRAATVSFALPRDLSDDLHALLRRDGRTVFMGLLAGFFALLRGETGRDDVAVGTSVAGRTRAELEPVLGYFVNTLVLRADLSDDPSLRQLIDRVRDLSLTAYAHQDVPFERVVQDLQPKRDANRTPFFDVMFEMEEPPDAPAAIAGLDISPQAVDFSAAKFDLEIVMADGSEGVTGVARYDLDLFRAETVDRLLAGYRRVLAQAVEQPDVPLSQLGAAVRQRVGLQGEEVGRDDNRLPASAL